MKKPIQFPHTFVIIFFVVLVCAVLTYIIPMGQYDTYELTYEQNGQEKTRTVLDSIWLQMKTVSPSHIASHCSEPTMRAGKSAF